WGESPASRNRWRAAATCALIVMWPRASDDRRVFELFRLVVGDQLIDQLAEVAVEDLREAMSREVDAVIGDPVLRKIVGPDFFRSIAAADLAAPVLGDRLLLLAHFHLVEPRAEHFHGLRAVLDLRLLVLLRHHQAGREVGEADGGIGGVDALAARPARAEGLDAQILLVDLDVHFLRFREPRARRR